ncbi:MAG: ABC transporter ATP-binding protein [Acidimicrobiaceae bacterium]|nr:ABC transporter ATP-binding protein [Acidimicrobiaceae bacterium]
MTAIRAEAVTKTYRQNKALDSVTFEIQKGAVAALVGENGAGKSTLLHILAGLVRPDSGATEVSGSAPSQDWNWLSRIGFVDQDASLQGGMTPGGYSKMGKDLNVLWNDDLLLARCDQLKIPSGRPIKQLSGGQRHVVAVLLALAKEPEVMLLDEPLASLDPISRRTLLGTLLSHAYDKSTTILLSSHLVSDLERSCDYLVLLSGGSLVLSKPTDEILGTHYWITNSDKNLELIRQMCHLETDYMIELDSQILLSTTNHELATLAGAKPAGLEEIVIARMSGSPVFPGQARSEK